MAKYTIQVFEDIHKPGVPSIEPTPIIYLNHGNGLGVYRPFTEDGYTGTELDYWRRCNDAIASGAELLYIINHSIVSVNDKPIPNRYFIGGSALHDMADIIIVRAGLRESEFVVEVLPHG